VLRQCIVQLRKYVDSRAASRTAKGIADGVAARSLQLHALR